MIIETSPRPSMDKKGKRMIFLILFNPADPLHPLELIFVSLRFSACLGDLCG
jgi:hypothetical protein